MSAFAGLMVLGVDPSLTCTGLARTWESPEITSARITTQPASGLADVRQRIRYITGKVLRFAPEQCLTVIERPFIPQRGGSGQVIERAWLFGFLVDQLMQRGPVIEVGAKARAKYAADSGTATKATVLLHIRTKFPQLVVPDDNVADALALLGMGARWLGKPIDGEPSKKQMEAIRAVHWPIEGEK